MRATVLAARLAGASLLVLGCRSTPDEPRADLVNVDPGTGGSDVAAHTGGAGGAAAGRPAAQGGAAMTAGTGAGGSTASLPGTGGISAAGGGAGADSGVSADRGSPAAGGAAGAGGAPGDGAVVSDLPAAMDAGGPSPDGSVIAAPADGPAPVPPPPAPDANVPVPPAPSVDAAPAPPPGPPDRATAAADFFSLGKIHRIEVTIDPAVWQSFMQEHANILATPLWRQAAFKIDGASFAGVGFKTFGYGSRLAAPHKPNLHLDLNRFVPGQSLNGISRIRIKNNGQDTSGLRQAITYEGMRAAGLGAPRSGFTELFVNNEAYGFYAVEEAFTSGFVLERTGNDTGAAYEANDCRGFLPPAAGGCPAILGQYNRSFNQKAGAGEDLVALCTAMNGPAEAFIAAVEPLIDLDGWIKTVAIDTALAGDYDGFSTNANNFRMYHDTAINRLRLYIFGPDVTYDPDYLPVPDPIRPAPGMDCQERNPGYHDVFLEKLTGTPAGLGRYRQAVKQLRAGVMAPAALKARVDALWTLVGDEILADPRRDPAAIDPTRAKELIKTYLDARAVQLDAAGL